MCRKESYDGQLIIVLSSNGQHEDGQSELIAYAIIIINAASLICYLWSFQLYAAIYTGICTRYMDELVDW